MKFLKQTTLWLIKTSVYLSIVAFTVIYICSFMWFKMGMGHTQTIFNHAVMEANSSLSKVSINEGDLIIAKEYLFFRTPDVNDIVVYPYDDKIQISIVEAIYEDKEGIPTYKVTPDNSELPVNLYKDNITGELYIIADGLGKIGLFVISPTFLVLLYLVVGYFFVLIKKLDKKIKNTVVEDETNVSSANDSSKSITSNSDNVESNSSLDENISDSTEPDNLDSEDETNVDEETSVNEEVDTSSSENDNVEDYTDNSNSSETELKDETEDDTDNTDSLEETTENIDFINKNEDENVVNEDSIDDIKIEHDESNKEDITLENEDTLSSNTIKEEVEEIIEVEDIKEIEKELVIKNNKDKALHNKLKRCNKKIKSTKLKKTHFNKHNRKKNKRKTKHINKYNHNKMHTIKHK